jgi:citrate lyase beta subunit
MPTTSLDEATLSALQAQLDDAQRAFVARFPGDGGARQPVSVLYGGAHLFTAEAPARLGVLARRAFETYAPDAASLAEALGLAPPLAARVHPRVAAKLASEPVEDLRVDFEDGYGHRSDEEEDGHALAVGRELARGLREGRLPPFIGVRVKPMSAELGGRALRTLDLVVTTLCRESNGALPQGFVVTLPKVVSPAQVRVFVQALAALERALGLAAGALRFELMVEAAQGLVDPEGRAVLPQLHAAAGGRLRGAHFGAYDFTASLEVAASAQTLGHPACDAARLELQRAFAGTGVFLSDGATTVLPVPPHKGDALTEAQRLENRRAVHAAWRLAAADTRRSLEAGFYQGWDLHPGQLVSRYAAVSAFFLEGLDAATARLGNFVKGLGQATRSGEVFDDAATGQGLLNFFLRGLSCGALTEGEALATGLTLDELRGRSFAAIARARRGRR